MLNEKKIFNYDNNLISLVMLVIHGLPYQDY